MIKSIIFDYDDTLVNTIEVVWDHHKATGRNFYDIEITDEDLRLHWGKPFPELVRNLYREVASVDQITNNYLSTKENYKKTFLPGVYETLKKLKGTDLLLGVVTSMIASYVRKEIAEVGLHPSNLTFLQGAEDTKFHKPDPRVFEPTLKVLMENSVNAKESVYVGDSIKDYLAASAAGMNFIGVLTGLTTADEFRDAGAIYVESFESILDRF